MRLLGGWAAGCCLVLAASTASAQGPGPYASPYGRASDFDDPYYTPMAPRGPLSRGDGIGLVPPHEVFAAMREAGFLPTGVPRLRGFTYVINAIDRRGGDGRLVVDARTGEIVNFVPSEGYEEGMSGPPGGSYGPRGAPPLPPPPLPAMSNAPRPPAAIPHVASRTVPQPMPRPAAAAPQAAARPEAAPQPPQQPAASEAKPAPVTAAAAPAAPSSPAPTVGQVKPAPQGSQILPTQPMPEAQGLEF
ncbi:hypothetical protein [Bradyrhizobium sp.]|uniref:hypothetical protein n=1 Tax=Bradyrhizobium sp. TaxID=376 RepID=UPI001D995E5C|nr:hypothetical protein [Bradyrhizobium sp.]MBV8699701.1 hypothetical protein [Bradyrhizobium sp.]MBV9984889.1 hypothetical protein [Bradyrhizobium sp.]